MGHQDFARAGRAHSGHRGLDVARAGVGQDFGVVGLQHVDVTQVVHALHGRPRPHLALDDDTGQPLHVHADQTAELSTMGDHGQLDVSLRKRPDVPDAGTQVRQRRDRDGPGAGIDPLDAQVEIVRHRIVVMERGRHLGRQIEHGTPASLSSCSNGASGAATRVTTAARSPSRR